MYVDSALDTPYAPPSGSGQTSPWEEKVRGVINPTQALILGSLHSENMSGAQIIAVANQIAGFWNSTRSQVYREMPGLEAKGYIKVIRDKVPAQYKELYSITPAGKKAYQQWRDIASPPDLLRNPWMLRYVLASHDGTDPVEVCKMAADYYRHARMRLEAEGGVQVCADALGQYYTLMEEWFLAQAG